MVQQNVNETENTNSNPSSGVVVPEADAMSYYGDYSEEIYRYIQQHDIGGNVTDIKSNVSNLVTISSRILIVLLFFVFIFYAFKFIRLKGLDL